MSPYIWNKSKLSIQKNCWGQDFLTVCPSVTIRTHCKNKSRFIYLTYRFIWKRITERGLLRDPLLFLCKIIERPQSWKCAVPDRLHPLYVFVQSTSLLAFPSTAIIFTRFVGGSYNVGGSPYRYITWPGWWCQMLNSSWQSASRTVCPCISKNTGR